MLIWGGWSKSCESAECESVCFKTVPSLSGDQSWNHGLHLRASRLISLSVGTSERQRAYWLGTGHKIPYGGVDRSRLLGPDYLVVLELQIDAMFDELKPLLEA